MKELYCSDKKWDIRNNSVSGMAQHDAMHGIAQQIAMPGIVL